MDKLEKVELIREKCEVSYADATAALDHANGDVLDAIIWLEEQGKTKRTTAQASTAPSSHENSMSKEMAQAQAAYRKSTESMWSSLTKLLKKSLKYKFIATRHGEVLLRIPVLLPIVGVFLWGATIWLLIIGLFFDIRYRIEGIHSVTIEVNEAMDQAAAIASNLKDKIKEDTEDSTSA